MNIYLIGVRGSGKSAVGRRLAAEIRQTLAVREPLYRRAMQWAVDTDGLSVAAVCRRVGEQIAKG